MKITRRQLRNLTQGAIGQLTETADEFETEKQVKRIKTLGDNAIKAAKGGDWGPGATTARGFYDEITSSVLGTDGQHSNAIANADLGEFKDEIDDLIKTAVSDLARNTDPDVSEGKASLKITHERIVQIIKEEVHEFRLISEDSIGKDNYKKGGYVIEFSTDDENATTSTVTIEINGEKVSRKINAGPDQNARASINQVVADHRVTNKWPAAWTTVQASDDSGDIALSLDQQ